MAVRTLNERKARSLTDARVRHAKPGKHYNLNGLFLLVESGGSRRWVQRIVIQGKRRDLGLGSYPLVSLAEAREAAADNRKVARAGGEGGTLPLPRSAHPPAVDESGRPRTRGLLRSRESSLAQLLAAKDNILRFLQQIPLTDEERAAVDGDLNAIDRLTQHLADRPTPSGQTPAELRTDRHLVDHNPEA